MLFSGSRFRHSTASPSNSSSSSPSMTGVTSPSPACPPSAPAPSKQSSQPRPQTDPPEPQQPQRSQQQQYGHLQGQAAIIPLQLQHGAVVARDLNGRAVLDVLSSAVDVNELVSSQGAVVLGVASGAKPVSLIDMRIGQVKYNRMLACSRCKLWWMTPEWRTSTVQLPPETQFLLLELEQGGPYALILPLIDGNFRATLRPSR
ncbi:MAG: hypothetical protein WDW36_003181 [Sanguina aurantia]